MNEIIKMIIVTTFICVFSAALLGGLKEGLNDRIIKQEDLFVRGPAIKSLLEGSPNDPLTDKTVINLNGADMAVYPWIENSQVKRIALESTGQGGYGGDVTVMAAIDLRSDQISGIEVTQHKETPGVGTRVTEPGYLNKYRKISINQEIKLGKDVDAISGATKTSTAVADGINKAAQLVSKNKEYIIGEIKKSKGI
ncbi:FMN-binding protein [bacterium]|nr:FMN-binding protein [candidate division CSSED10-310 bacterium]